MFFVGLVDDSGVTHTLGLRSNFSILFLLTFLRPQGHDGGLFLHLGSAWEEVVELFYGCGYQ